MRPLSAHLYAAAATLATPALGVMLRRRAARGKEIAARLPERRGFATAQRPAGKLLWVHAASVGETISLLPVLAALAEKAPALTVLLTTGTVTSARLLATRLPELGLAGRVLHRFSPLDVPAWAARFLDHWRPDAAAMVESELWPNLLAACARRQIPTMLVNARLSPRSHARWRRAPGLARELLEQFACIEARSEEDAERLRSLRARDVVVPGDLKFAAPPLPADAAELQRLRQQLNGRPVWLAGSTHPGEDEAALAAHRALAPLHPGLLTIIVPRHPERGPGIAALANGVSPGRRAAGAALPDAAGIYIADTLGELGLWYRLAPIAFIGGSLVPHGGQNLLEAGRLGCAIAAGPHMGNFAAAVAALEQAGAIRRVADAASLGGWVDAMLADPAGRQQMGEAARRAADRWADLPARCAVSLLGLLARRQA